jgi:hypothetical protein
MRKVGKEELKRRERGMGNSGNQGRKKDEDREEEAEVRVPDFLSVRFPNQSFCRVSSL